jgi:hypothetical protein
VDGDIPKGGAGPIGVPGWDPGADCTGGKARGGPYGVDALGAGVLDSLDREKAGPVASGIGGRDSGGFRMLWTPNARGVRVWAL